MCASSYGKSCKGLFAEGIYRDTHCHNAYMGFLQSFDIHFNMVTDSKDSMLAAISSIIVPVFKPLGLGDWRICTSLISGLIAKESVVSYTGDTVWRTRPQRQHSQHFQLHLFWCLSLLYSPCVAAIASHKERAGWQSGQSAWCFCSVPLHGWQHSLSG